ncbi:MAG TPA: FG-GAP-like repeat-containing protein, partial [Blastocatellia bacterium]|nr:FG-GAP-like repeat-containing protein [Blastocatellia bacterium]
MNANRHLGSLNGQFSVDCNGGAVYSVPLQVPPGTAGLMPSLSLVYNSGGGNGLAGMGWSLHGLSSVSRTAATMAQDRFISPVQYGPNDRFSLDGQRLVAIQGEYGSKDAVYHTEIESWRRIVPVYKDSVRSRSGPDSFLVQTKDGKVAEYGTSADAQIEASSKNPSIRVWALNRITDLNGNYMTITYRQDSAGGGFYPERIDYSGNDKTGLSPQRSVRFTYEPRPDKVPQYLGGYRVLFTERLSKVETFVGDELVLQYQLAYQQGEATGRSRLISVTQLDAEGVPLTPTVFQWQDSVPANFGTALDLDADQLPGGGTVLPMDVNGDGLVDLVYAYSVRNSLQLDLMLSKPDGTGFEKKFTIKPTGLDYGPEAPGVFLPMDVNGDGCIDLVYATEINSQVALTVLTASFVEGQWTLVPGPLNCAFTGAPLTWGGTLLPMDVDADGKADLVYASCEEGVLNLKVLFSDGTAFTAEAETKTNLDGDGQSIAVDINGDGMTDLVYALDNGGTLGLTLFLSQGRKGLIQAGSPLPDTVNLPYGGSLVPTDVNGDGLTDLVYAFQDQNQDTMKLLALLSNGVGFEPQEVLETGINYTPDSPDSPLVLPMDLNGDGLTDILVATQGAGDGVGFQVFISTGSGFTTHQVSQSLSNPFWGGSLLPVDLDGNGKTDLLYATEVSSMLALTRVLAAGPFPDLLTKITNGLGGTIETAYKPLTDPAVYSKGSSASASVEAQSLFNNRISGASFTFPTTQTLGGSSPGAVYASQTVDFPKYVVAGYVKRDGRGGEYDYGFVDPDRGSFYRGARIDLTGRGWLGFESITMHDNNLETTTVTDYNQFFPLTATVDSSRITRTRDKSSMKLTSIEYKSVDPGSGTKQVLISDVKTDFYTPSNDKPDSTHLKLYDYDEFGNVIQTTESSNEPGSLPLFTFHSYLNDADRWRLGYKIETQTARDQQGASILTWHQSGYDPDTFNKITHKVWNDSKLQWLVTTFGYDSYGNRTSATDASGALTTMNFDDTYHTFVVETISPPNQNGDSLVTSFDYYFQFGTQKTRTSPRLTSDTEPGRIIRQNNVDGLGRVIEVLGPDPSNSLVALSRRSWQADGLGVYRESLTLLDWNEPAWRWQRHYLDGLGRIYRSVALGPDGKTPVLIEKTFDSRNNWIKRSLPYYEGSTPVFVERSYDSYARLIEEIKPVDGGCARTTWTYENSFTVVQTQAADSPDARRT